MGDVAVPVGPPGPAFCVSTSDLHAVFKIGETWLVLDSEDPAFLDGFRRLYIDCEVVLPAAAPRQSDAHLCVQLPAGGAVTVEALRPDDLDLAQFFESTFAERGCRRVSTEGDRVGFSCANPAVDFVVQGRVVHFRAGQDWEGLAGNLALALAMRQQPDVLFLHAAGIVLAGTSRGVLLVGGKGSGKTTTALGMGSRGHGFLGDEIIGVKADGRLLPVRRAISKRPGPCAGAVDEALRARPVTERQYPDGQTRTIVVASDVFGDELAPASLDSVVFLNGFAETPALTPVTPSFEWAAKMTPVMSGTGQSAAAGAFVRLRLLGRASTFALQVGPPDATCEAIERGTHAP